MQYKNYLTIQSTCFLKMVIFIGLENIIALLRSVTTIPRLAKKKQKEYGLKKVGENPLNGSAQPLSNKGDDIV